jgi:ectoine utilization protein EutC
LESETLPENASSSRTTMSKRQALILREAEVRSLLDPAGCLYAVESALSAYARAQAELPSVINLDVPEQGGEIHVKAGYLHGAPYYAVKIASGFPGNPQFNLPSSDGMVLVFDAQTGALAGLLLDNGYITDLRTGAAGAVAAKYLARTTVEKVAVLGTGAQARYQIRSLALVRDFRMVKVWGRNREKAAACVEDLSQEGLPAHCQAAPASSVREAIDSADIVITVTASREPLVQADWIAKGALVVALGSDGPDKQELDVEVLARADRIVADSLPQCLRLGEIHHAVEKGAISRDKVTAELGEITAGMKPGRTSDDEIIVCDLTGVGVQDVAAASLVMERALQSGAGERLPL